jgi:hypothetical protein
VERPGSDRTVQENHIVRRAVQLDLVLLDGVEVRVPGVLLAPRIMGSMATDRAGFPATMRRSRRFFSAATVNASSNRSRPLYGLMPPNRRKVNSPDSSPKWLRATVRLTASG